MSKTEAAVIDTAAFQRLHYIKQLGCANLVYPGADYSRFSHSVGVCHLVGRLMERLFERNGAIGTDQRRIIQMFRLAGLLHDIGHYPYSHATERAIETHYKSKLVSAENEEDADGDNKAGVALDHESTGQLILSLDGEIKEALKTGPFNLDARDIGLLFHHDDFQPYSNILSSDLDADRMDHVSRTSHFAGLPYGPVDLDYIVSQICADDRDHAVLTRRAIRAVDHLLISRMFDFRQVAKHRTVAGFEWLLEDVLAAVLDASPSLRWDEPGIAEMVKEKTWANFTDSYIFELIQSKLSDECKEPFKSDAAKQKARALLSRRPPKMVGEIERYALRGKPGEKDQYSDQLGNIEGARLGWAKHFGMDPDLWKVLAIQKKITAMGSDFSDEDDIDENSLGLVDEHKGHAVPINTQPQSFMSVLSKYNLDLIRIFVLLPEGSKDSLKDEIRAKIRADFLDYKWS